MSRSCTTRSLPWGQIIGRSGGRILSFTLWVIRCQHLRHPLVQFSRMEPSIMQKQFVRTLLLVFVLLDAALVQVAAQPDPVRREFIIQNFRTESGIVLPEARIVYGTYGKLNEAADNAVLLPSHFMATLNGYDWLI